MGIDISKLPKNFKDVFEEAVPLIYLNATDNTSIYLDVSPSGSPISDRCGCMALGSWVKSLFTNMEVFDWQKPFKNALSQLIKDGFSRAEALKTAAGQVFVSGRNIDPRFEVESSIQIACLYAYNVLYKLEEDPTVPITLLAMYFPNKVISSILEQNNNRVSEIPDYKLFGMAQTMTETTDTEMKFITRYLVTPYVK